MKKYRITIPKYTAEVSAESECEALERFWRDFDKDQQSAPIEEIHEVKK